MGHDVTEMRRIDRSVISRLTSLLNFCCNIVRVAVSANILLQYSMLVSPATISLE